MTKFGVLFQLVAAGVLTVPVVVDGESAQGLTDSLQRTVTAIEQLVGIQARLQSGDLDVARVFAATPPVTGAERELDARLANLRQDVGRLQQLVDENEARGTVGSQPPSQLAQPQPEDQTAVGPLYHTGLDEAARNALSQITPPLPGGQSNTLARTQRREFESPGFSADPVKHGRAYYRAGRYEAAIKVLEGLDDDPTGIYWIARSLEKLGRHEQALEHYRRVAESEKAGYLKERAKHDLDFLEWKVRFEARRKQKEATQK